MHPRLMGVKKQIGQISVKKVIVKKKTISGQGCGETGRGWFCGYGSEFVS